MGKPLLFFNFIWNGFIKKIQNGAYLVNPNILMKGNDNKRQMLLSYYEEDKPLNSIEVLRGKQKPIPEAEDGTRMYIETERKADGEI